MARDATYNRFDQGAWSRSSREENSLYAALFCFAMPAKQILVRFGPVSGSFIDGHASCRLIREGALVRFRPVASRG